ncbi:carotenoid biosynthesis protein, partial [Chloroflexota bacterium]
YLLWVNKSKPSRHKRDLGVLLLLIVMDGLIVVFIDLLMEPLQVRAGNWVWLTTGSYFNIPVGNFVGWFIVTVTATGLFRSFEYLFPPRNERVVGSVMLIPVIGYGVLSLALVWFSLTNQSPILAVIGSLTMFPVMVINLKLYTIWKKKFIII